MKNINIKAKTSTLFLLALISACSSPAYNLAVNNSSQTESINKIATLIKGKSEFPELTSSPALEKRVQKNQGDMSVKATIGQIRVSATVSLIYPPDHPTMANQTAATGLSDANGQFSISLGSTPATNEMFILEATKRIGTSGNALMSIRTYIRWNGTMWESITSPNIAINKNTTAITIIDSYDNSISPADTISKINNGVISAVNSVTTTTINIVANMAEYLLNSDNDPVRFINFQNNKYFINREISVNKNYLISNKSCPNCDLTSENLKSQNLTNAILKNANLRNANLGNANITNANLTGANLTNVDLTNANLTNANLTGANLTNTNFSNATWISGTTTCLTGSIGKCLFPDVLVDTFTLGNQQKPSIVSDNTGNFVVAWTSAYAQDGSSYGIYVQRYNSSGVRQIPSGCAAPTCDNTTGEFRANTYTTNAQSTPNIAMDDTGNFVVVWTSSNQDGSGTGVYAQRYNSSGIRQIPSGCAAPTCNPATGEFRVNTYTTSAQANPSVAIDSTGNFVISWTSQIQGGTAFSVDIYAQRYNSSGIRQIPSGCAAPTCNPATGEFRVNTYTTNSQANPSVAIDSTGNFTIVWASQLQGGTAFSTDIYAQRYNSSGIRQIPSGCAAPMCDTTTGEFRVNTYTTSVQFTPNIAMDNTGNFTIVWASGYQDNDSHGIYAQRYNNVGTRQIPSNCSLPECEPSTGEFRVNTYTTNNQLNPNIAMDNTGNFVISWQSTDQDNSGDGIYAQKYNNMGLRQIPSNCSLPECEPSTGEFKINYITLNNQQYPSVAMDNTGNFVVAWMSYHDGSYYGIYHKKYDSTGNPR